MTETSAPPVIPVEQEMSLLARDILEANAAVKQWEERAKALKTRLTELWTVGVVPTTFLEHGYNFTLQDGKEGLDIDDEGKQQIETLKAQLIEEGHAEPKAGNPFWVARKAAQPKASKTRKTKSVVSAIDAANPAILQQRKPVVQQGGTFIPTKWGEVEEDDFLPPALP